MKKGNFMKDIIKNIIDTCLEYGKEYDELCAEVIEKINDINKKR